MNNATGKEDSMIVDLFHHNTWANLRLLEACEGLTEAQLDTTVPGTYGTIRDTLWHILRAEVSYVKRVSGHLPDELLKRDEFPGFDALKRVTNWCGEELLALALTASPTDMVQEESQELPKEKVQYKLTSLLMQAINHGNEHRAQVATILTQEGIEPPDMSGWGYMEAMGEFVIETTG